MWCGHTCLVVMAPLAAGGDGGAGGSVSVTVTGGAACGAARSDVGGDLVMERGGRRCVGGNVALPNKWSEQEHQQLTCVHFYCQCR